MGLLDFFKKKKNDPEDVTFSTSPDENFGQVKGSEDSQQETMNDSGSGDSFDSGSDSGSSDFGGE